MISFTDVSKRYKGGQEALKQITCQIDTGEMCFLTGHSGAGKSTFLRLAALIERADRGQVLVNGQNLGRIPNCSIPYFRRQIGMVFQNHHLLSDRTVFDNVALPLVIAGFRHQEIRRRVHAALDKVKLLHKEKARPHTLSTGQQQRVAIARAVVNKPPILLADEPTGNLDPALSLEIMNIFMEFRSLGTTVLIVSHDIHLLRKFQCSHLILRDGELIDESL